MIVIYVAAFILSLYLLYYSSNYVVKYSNLLAHDMNIPALIIGLFMVAIGTSLPELVSGINAVLQGHSEMSIGNVLGSVIANSTLILGISALIFPMQSNLLLFIISASFMVLVGVVFTAFVEEGNKITWFEGLSLIMMYIFFLIVEFYIQNTVL